MDAKSHTELLYTIQQLGRLHQLSRNQTIHLIRRDNVKASAINYRGFRLFTADSISRH